MREMKLKQHWLAAGASVCWLAVNPVVVQAAEPVKMGDLLQAASTACEQGDAAGLQKHSERIRRVLEQSRSLPEEKRDYVDRLLKLFANGVCKPGQKPLQPKSKPAEKQEDVTTRKVKVVSGYLDNVNQGSRHESIIFNNPLTGVEVEGELLDYQPLSSAFIGVQGLYHRKKYNADGERTDTYARVSQQFYSEQSDFNTTGLTLARQKEIGKDALGSVYMDMVRSNGNTRGTLGTGYAQIWERTGDARLSWNAGLEYDFFPQLDNYDSISADVGVEKRKALKENGTLILKAGLEYDHALDSRPGGDRTKVSTSAGWRSKKEEGWQKTANLRLEYKRDAEPYDEVLFGDSTRNQTRTVLDLGVNKQMGKDKKLQFGYQYSQTRDSEMKLFDQPAGNVFTIGFESEF